MSKIGVVFLKICTYIHAAHANQFGARISQLSALRAPSLAPIFGTIASAVRWYRYTFAISLASAGPRYCLAWAAV
jgi:hypothetical protein